jgi:hypothetical protein
MKIDRCMNCQSDKVIPSVRISDQGEHSSGDLELVVQGDPDAMFFKESHWGAIQGWLCCSCGFVHTFCTGNLDALYQAYQKSQSG